MTDENRLQVLDKGFVRRVDHGHDDLTVVNAARVSFAKEQTELDPERDPKLINYLAKHNHWTPFGHARQTVEIEFESLEDVSLFMYAADGLGLDYRYLRERHLKFEASVWAMSKLGLDGGIWLKLPHSHKALQYETFPANYRNLSYGLDVTAETYHIKMPIFVARQWMRSNVGIVYNEVSRRYVDDEPEFYYPKNWRLRPDKSIKQGSGTNAGNSLNNTAGMWATIVCDDECLYHYNRMLKCDIAPEMARMILPQNMYTEVWMTATPSALERIIGLRDEGHAQLEIQEYARAIRELRPG